MIETNYCFTSTSLCKIAKITFCSLMRRLFFDELESTYQKKKKKRSNTNLRFTDNSVVLHVAGNSLQEQELFLFSNSLFKFGIFSFSIKISG